MKIKINQTFQYNSYSKVSAWIAFVFAVYGFILLYVEESNYWILIGLSLLLTLMSLLYGVDFIINLFNLSLLPRICTKLSLSCIALGYLIGSIYGVIRFIKIIPINDRSIFFVPFVALSLIFAGSSLGLLVKGPK